MAITFYLVVIGWVFFRATEFDSAFDMLAQMHGVTSVHSAPASSMAVLILVVLGLVMMHVMDALRIRYGHVIENRIWLLVPVLILGFFIVLLVGDAGHDFIYFQF